MFAILHCHKNQASVSEFSSMGMNALNSSKPLVPLRSAQGRGSETSLGEFPGKAGGRVNRAANTLPECSFLAFDPPRASQREGEVFREAKATGTQALVSLASQGAGLMKRSVPSAFADDAKRSSVR